MPVLDKLFVALGYDYDEEDMGKFNKLVNGTIRFLKRLTITLIGAATALALFLSKFVRSTVQLHRMAKGFGVLRKELVAFQRISERLTGSTGPGEGLLDRLSRAQRNRTIGQLDTGMAQAFSVLGLDTLQVLESGAKEAAIAIAKEFRNSDELTQQRFQAFSGFDNATIQLLRGLIRGGLAANEPPAASLAASEKFNSLLFDLKHTLENLGIRIANKILPVINRTVVPLLKKLSGISGEGFEEFFAMAKEKFFEIVELLGSIGRDIATVAKWIAGTLGKFKINDRVSGNPFSEFFTGPPELSGPFLEAPRHGKINREQVGPTMNIENININSTGSPEAVGNEVVGAIRRAFERVSMQAETEVVS